MLKVLGLTPEEDKYPFGAGSGRALSIKKKKKALPNQTCKAAVVMPCEYRDS